MKGTLIEEQRAFSVISLLPWEGVSAKFIPLALHACATNGASLVSIGQ
jgi:hypothetical protein